MTADPTVLAIYVSLIIIFGLCCWFSRAWLRLKGELIRAMAEHEKEREVWAVKEQAVARAFLLVGFGIQDEWGRDVDTDEQMVLEWSSSHFLKRIEAWTDAMDWSVRDLVRTGHNIRDRLSELGIDDEELNDYLEEFDLCDDRLVDWGFKFQAKIKDAFRRSDAQLHRVLERRNSVKSSKCEAFPKTTHSKRNFL